MLALALAFTLTAADADLTRKLQAAVKAKGTAYTPRTRHLSPRREPLYTNRLILETSPYLLQHAHNPVDWRPWGDEAFEAAKKLGRPVLLSVGYSTCHWCHVMEEESFEDPEIARYLNGNYIAIKVDREERPDVDSIYMTAVQTLTGAAGGWPMTVWLAPDRRPFHAATYIPPRDGDRGVQTGFLTMLRKLKEAYDTDPQRVTDTATAISRAVREALAPQPGGDVPPAETLRKAATVAADWFDPVEGGVKGAPKFPSGLPQRFLLRHHRRSGDARALAMARLTLEKIARGGIHDHAGGGFHRYATDARWLIPHFEKMLYDNALLALDYLEAFQATGADEFAQAARGILRWVERDMTSPEGGFYSATDADSLDPSGKREEGWFFTWTPEEIEAVAGADRARLLRSWFGMKAGGNFEGRSILHTPRPIAEAAAEAGWSPEKARPAIEESKELLYAARRRRPPPLRDEKILTSWNGLMISAHARASLVLADRRYSMRAARAAAFVLRNLKRNGRLLRSYKDGDARHNGYLDDYAFFTAGLLDLYESTGAAAWLREAITLDAVMEKYFEDRKQGGFYFTSNDHETLLAREKPAYDGAEPSGNSVHVMNLLRLSTLTTADRYRQRAVRALGAFRQRLVDNPLALAEMLLALDFRHGVPKEIVIVTPAARAEAEPFLARLRRTYVPNRVLIVTAQAGIPDLSKVVPLVEGKTARQGRATAYVCVRGVCDLPATDPEVFARQISR